MSSVCWTHGSVFINVVFLLVFLQVVSGIKIKNLKVPEVAHFGSPVILDCEYSVDDDEEGLVVKWYFNRIIVYQWIPKINSPTESGLFKGRLNLNYSASENKNSKHRALHILDPDPSMSGNYTCSVSTFKSEDSQTKKMIVLVPQKNLELGRRFINSKTMQLLCSAERVFPRPTINLYMGNSAINDSIVTFNGENFFDVKAIANVTMLIAPEEFSCELDIPEANYTARKEAIYYPDFSAATRTPLCFVIHGLLATALTVLHVM